MNEPLWKIVLCWGVVVTFLTMPLCVLAVQIYANTHPGWWTWTENLTPEQHRERYQYLSEFMRNLSILVFGLSGLRTWESIKANGIKKKEENNADSRAYRKTSDSKEPRDTGRV